MATHHNPPAAKKVPKTLASFGDKRIDNIRYLVQKDGSVVLQRAEEADDPALGAFLDFLARDIAAHPERVRAIDAGLAKRMRALTKGVRFDLDETLDPENE